MKVVIVRDYEIDNWGSVVRGNVLIVAVDKETAEKELIRLLVQKAETQLTNDGYVDNELLKIKNYFFDTMLVVGT